MRKECRMEVIEYIFSSGLRLLNPTEYGYTLRWAWIKLLIYKDQNRNRKLYTRVSAFISWYSSFNSQNIVARQWCKRHFQHQIYQQFTLEKSHQILIQHFTSWRREYIQITVSVREANRKKWEYCCMTGGLIAHTVLYIEMSFVTTRVIFQALHSKQRTHLQHGIVEAPPSKFKPRSVIGRLRRCVNCVRTCARAAMLTEVWRDKGIVFNKSYSNKEFLDTEADTHV